MFYFFGCSFYPQGRVEIVKKNLNFPQILDVYGISKQWNHEKLTKIKVILEMCVVLKFKKSTNTPGGNQFSEHHGGVKLQNFVEKKAEKSVFQNFDPLKYAEHA